MAVECPIRSRGSLSTGCNEPALPPVTTR
jgi:hypothetical protein